MDGIINGTDKVIELWDSGLIPKIAEVALALVGLKLAVDTITLIKTAILGVSGAIGLILAHPVLAVIALLGLAAGALILNWDTVGPYFEKLVKDMETGFSDLWSKMKTGWENAKQVHKGLFR